MNPMDRMYAYGGEGWRESTRSFGPYGEYGGYLGSGYFDQLGYGYRRDPYERQYRERAREPYGSQETGEHVWRGGLLGWLGSGVRAGAAWIGQQMQSWGALLGGKLKGTSEELGRAMRGRGEQVGSAMEHRGEDMMQGARYRQGRPSRSYRRPDERILDDVHQRIAMSGVDADDVEIEVHNGVVTLSGRVPRRFDKRVIDEVTEQVFGVQEVQNHLRLARRVDETETGTMAGDGHGSTSFRATPDQPS